ncbi:hypothetical protein MNBD_GAMMA07-1637 [hydrothermal vent metagenome]|uniref:Uncharacterized protein n=1 Tax=hydrothermal vent metagenome TaxID=652676 RepID=A0A3B0WP83_9ZZZZ
MKRVIKKTLTPVFITTVMILGISTTWAGPNENNNGNKLPSASSSLTSSWLSISPLKIPDIGVAHLSAVVNADGKLIRGSGVKSTTPAKGFIGDYIVTFNRNVRNCTYVVSLGNTASSGVPQLGVISATGAAVNPNGVYIDANSINGIPAKRPFHLNVFCHK